MKIMSKPDAKALLQWVDDRFPLSELYNRHLKQYYAPKNLNFWYIFGSLALTVLAIQLVTGIFLAMHYKPDAASFLLLGYLGTRAPTAGGTYASQVLTILYFAFFLTM